MALILICVTIDEPLSRQFHPERCGSKYLTQQFLLRNVSHHGDGIMTFLGRKFGAEQWMNPAVRGFVKLDCSGLDSGASIERVLDCFPVGPCLSPKESPWIQFDFGQKLRVRPSAYALIHSVECNDRFLRNWVFEGSEDGDHWTALKDHEKDTTLREKGQSHTWPLFEVQEFYQKFRVRMTGMDSSGEHGLMRCPGLEMYGLLVGTQ